MTPKLASLSNLSRQKRAVTKHGLSTSKPSIYTAWVTMRRRCRYPNDKRFKNWAGRGIRVCRRWHTFLNFYKDMAASWREGLVIDRRHNDRDYTPSNCRWVPMLVQQNNKRSNVRLVFMGENKTLSEWARHLGLSRGTIKTRYRLKLHVNEILFKGDLRLNKQTP